jgi:hypothetical protein
MPSCGKVTKIRHVMSETAQVTGDEGHPSALSVPSSAAFQLKGEPEIHAIAGDESNRSIALGKAKQSAPEKIGKGLNHNSAADFRNCLG